MYTGVPAFYVLDVKKEIDYINDKLSFTFRDEAVTFMEILDCSVLHLGAKGIGIPVRLDYIAQSNADSREDYLYRHQYITKLCSSVAKSVRKKLIQFMPAEELHMSHARTRLYRWFTTTDIIVLVEPRKYEHANHKYA